MSDRVGQQLGNYRLISLLGKGGFAEVYLGEHIYLKSRAAIKVMHTRLADEDMESFLSEARTVVYLTHPLIVRVLDFGVEGNTPFLVMDYAPNGTLRQRHPKGTRVPLPTIVSYVKQVADALQYAHDQKLVHRDIKPENMLLGRHYEVLLSDFGIAIVAQTSLHQGIQDIAGTLAYMAPEQLRGQSRPASDQYALGVIVYEWLSGERPFSRSTLEIASNQMFTPPPPLRQKIPTIPLEVEQVVLTALALEPHQRFANVQAFAQALNQASSFSTTSSFPAISPYATPSRTLPISTPPPGIVNQPSQGQQQLSSQYSPTVIASSGNQPVSLQKPFVTPIFSGPETPVSTNSPARMQQRSTSEIQSVQPTNQNTNTDPSQQQRPQKKSVRNILLIVLAFLIIATTATAVVILRPKPSSGPPGNGIGIIKEPNGDYIGISDGTFAFDTNRPDGALKIQAAEKLKAHQISAAKSLWQSALQEEPTDAETLINLENQRVLASGHSYVTFVVGTVITGNAVGVGRQNLQGAFIVQKEFNDGMKLPGGVQIRLLIANSGNQPEYATMVAQQIVQSTRADKTIIGVMGWPFGMPTQKAITVLGAAHIPMISPTANDDFLTGISPYFFRVVLSIHRQAGVGAQYAEHIFHAKSVALFLDPANTYSKNLATNFEQRFVADGNTIVATERYTVGQTEMLPGLLQDALHANPDLIYFAGYADDVKTLLAHLPTSGALAHLQVLGGDALYEDYHSGTRIGLKRLHFSASAYSAEWDALNLAAKKPPFFTEYRKDFYPNQQSARQGYTNPGTATILSYDAMLALLIGSSNAFAVGKKSISPRDLREGLIKIIGSHAIQGVSGQISFGLDGDPVNKAVVFLSLDPTGEVQMESVEGTFLLGS